METWPRNPLFDILEGKYTDRTEAELETACRAFQAARDAHSAKLADRWNEHQAQEHPEKPGSPENCFECHMLMKGHIRSEEERCGAPPEEEKMEWS